MPNQDPKTVHVWMPDGRSLCDRRAESGPRSTFPTVDEHEANERATANAPACGACLLLVSYLRTQATAILEEQPSVWPSSVGAAWASLDGTRWAQRFDPIEHSKTPGLDDYSRFDALRFAIDPEKVRRTLAANETVRAQQAAHVRAHWEG
ncbi:hypothetical protein [Microbacterium algeriense]|uniref:hypothetical protein n=1 Tax=Microbacterium algeriense TaxID=2615184 RepID=UPI0022E5CC99|nr:hypothetical protein [Microbacterium algeriense]